MMGNNIYNTGTDMDIDLKRIKSNFGISWIESDCKELYDGGYSKCLEKNGIVRKYFVHDNPGRFIEEYNMMLMLYDADILIPKPLDFGYDTIKRKWYIESEFLPFEPIPEVINRTLFDLIRDFISKIEKIEYIGNDNWSRQLDDFERSLQLYGREKNESVESTLNYLKGKKVSVFSHGDFLPKNLGLTERGIVAFDLQNGGQGPDKWDLCYFLSAYEPSFISEEIKSLISDEWLETIISILKIRIGRAIRKEMETDELENKKCAWENLRVLEGR